MDSTPLTQSQLWSALLPWIIVCVVMLVWGNGAFKTWANSIFTRKYPVPDLHNMINKVPPVAAKPTPEGAVFDVHLPVVHRYGHVDCGSFPACWRAFSPARMIGEYGRTSGCARSR